MTIIERGDPEPSDAPDSAPRTNTVLQRNTALARIWTARRTPIRPVEIADALAGRGIVPGLEEEGEDGTTSRTLTVVELSDAQFQIGPANSDDAPDEADTTITRGFRVQNLSSGRGLGCRVTVMDCDKTSLPGDYMARRTVPAPNLLYIVEAGGPSNSDRALTEHLAELLLVATDGLVEIRGLGTKGNKPKLQARPWIGNLPM